MVGHQIIRIVLCRCPPEIVRRVSECMTPDADRRPSMKEIVQRLQESDQLHPASSACPSFEVPSSTAHSSVGPPSSELAAYQADTVELWQTTVGRAGKDGA